MAAWSSNAVTQYELVGISIGAANPSGAIDDGAASDTGFTPSDSITSPYFSGTGSFEGTVDLLGTAWVKVVTADTAHFFASLPEPVDTSAINSAFAAIDGTPGNHVNIALENTTSFTTCFAPGTLIATHLGESPVEALRIGDLATTADGRAVPVKRIGRQSVNRVFAGERARPVLVAKGTLGNGLPHTDLLVTADHALILDGLAINAGALVNGTTIALEPLSKVVDRVTYYHVETEEHDVILANGAAAETFVDDVGRQAFDNYAEYLDLYGEECILAEMPLPRISCARLVPTALRKRLAGRAVA